MVAAIAGGGLARLRLRAEAGLLLATIVVGCQAVWLAVPTVILWTISRLSSSIPVCFFTALVSVPSGIVLLVALLGRVDRRYVAVRNSLRSEGWSEEDLPHLRGPLERVLPASVMLAAIGLVVWLTVIGSHLPYGREQLIP